MGLAWCTSCKLYFSELGLDEAEHILVDFRVERLFSHGLKDQWLAQLGTRWGMGISLYISEWAGSPGLWHWSLFFPKTSFIVPVFLILTAFPLVLHHCLQPFSSSLWISKATRCSRAGSSALPSPLSLQETRMESSTASGVFWYHCVAANNELTSGVFLGLAFQLASAIYIEGRYCILCFWVVFSKIVTEKLSEVLERTLIKGVL